ILENYRLVETDRMDLTGDMPVTLTIKAPNQRMEDQTVDCMLGWTIKKLKQHLENVYPSKPKHNEQRLIYSGRLLQDHLTLKEILRQYEGSEIPNNIHTVHLVCSSSADSSPSSASETKVAAENLRPHKSSSNVDTPRTEATPNILGEGLRHRFTQSHGDDHNFRQHMPHNIHNTNTFQEQVTNMNPEYHYSPEQYAWMMQNYAYSQYMMQYMQYYQAAYYSGLPYAGQMFPPNFAPQPVTSTDRQAQPQQQVPAAGQAARANVRMNAQGGVEEDDEEEGEPRDWLHHVYFFMRFLTFMGILFFYSNLTRFLVVFAGSISIYILQKLRKYWQRAQREQQQRQEQQQQQQQQPDQAEPNIERNPSDNEPEPRTETPNEDAQQDAQAEQVNEGNRVYGALLFVCTTIQSFFMSLLPTPPELLEAN
ncbi:homocysteine-responsive endoplasmic reticulum-resident ubiquitin-like domain member 2 protein, partial [Biomphalaria glabrata]